MLRPVHATNHGGIILVADLDCLQNVIRTSETLEPDDTVKLNLASFVEFIEWFQGEVAHISLLPGVVSRRWVFGHSRDSPDPERDTQQREHRFGQIREGSCGIRRVVVEHRDEEARGAEPFRELDDHGELVDEKMIGGMDDDADKVEMVLAEEVVEDMLVTVLTERSNEGGAMGSDPTVKGQECLYGAHEALRVHLCGVRAHDTTQKLNHPRTERWPSTH